MRRFMLAAVVCFVSGCGGSSVSAKPMVSLTDEEIAGELAVARAGCARCHALPANAKERLAPIAGPDLRDAVAWHADDGGEAFLRRHHGGDAAPELAMWVRSLGAAAAPLAPFASSTASIANGEALFRQLACQACHAVPALEQLARRTDVGHVSAFLEHPAAHRPGVVHDFALDANEATAIASWLLRSQVSTTTTAAVPGFAYECFEVQIDAPTLPKLDGLAPKAKGLVQRMDATVGTRADHFALRFAATLSVPATGDWKFTCGSDDSSWLWIDDHLIVRNEAIAPHRRRSGRVHLEAGPHDLRVVYTEAAGEQSLEVLWQGPGVSEQEIPAASAKAESSAFVPPATLPPPAAELVTKGREQAAARRCATCHEVGDAALAAAPVAAPARPFAALADGECPQVRGAAAVLGAVRSALDKAPDAAAELRFAMLRDGCVACHARGGVGGLTPVVRQGLSEVEDLGDEGRLPPDLGKVGHRLRRGWIEQVLTGARRARNYLKVRMPSMPQQLARRYTNLFTTVDGAQGDDDEPPFSLEQAELGRKLVGVTGKNCITCHTFAGKRALGPQGMDLGIQYERLRPAWFAEWLLHAPQLRTGTRMPALWLGGADDGHEVSAIRSWLSLGAAAPMPSGFANKAGLVLEPTERPVLHGAFLKGLSARCVAVGSPLRTHYAYDVGHARLAWLWRGDFLDADGTWSGRAGKLLEPLGDDQVVLDDLQMTSEPAPPAGDGEYRAVIGRRMDADGYPIWRLRVGTAEVEDQIRPRLVRGGSEMVRTLHVVTGVLQIQVGAMSGKARLVCTPANTTQLKAGESLEVVYQW